MSRSRPTARGILAAASLVALAAPWASPAPVGAQPDPGAVELPAVTLTTADLVAAGLEGFGLDTASVFGLADDVDYLSDSQGLDPEEIEATFVEAGHVGSYTVVHRQPAGEGGAADDPPAVQLQTTVYLFEDAEGAESAYAVIADESDSPARGGDVEGELDDLGDASELTAQADRLGGNARSTDLELEILDGEMVLELTLLRYPGETDDRDQPVVDPADVEALAALGERLLGRAEAARDGDAPGLTGQVVAVRSEVEEAAFVAYDLLDGDPVRLSGEGDAAFEDRAAGQLDRGTVSLLRSEQILTASGDPSEWLRLSNTLIALNDEAAAEAYMEGVAERLASSGANLSVEELDAPRLGDDTLALQFEREGPDGEPYVVNQIFVRVGTTVGVLNIQETVGDADDPVVPLDALVELGEVQAECLDARACEGPVAVPDALADIIDGDTLGPADEDA